MMGRTSFLVLRCGQPVRYTPRAAGVKAGRTRLAAAVVLALTAWATGAACAQEADEERPVFVNRIVFAGNASVSDDDLKERMRTREPSFFAIFSRPRLDRAQLDRDIRQLEAYYHSVGFFEARVRLQGIQYSADGRFADVHVEVQEGKPTLVRSMTFPTDALLDEAALRKDLVLKVDEPYNPSLLAADVYTIKTKYFDRGYLAVSVMDSVRIEGHRADVSFDIDPGNEMRVRNIEITGHETVRRSVIEKELAIKSGEVCRLSKLIETQSNLFETGLFTVVDVAPENIDPLSRTVDILVRLRERKASYVEAGFGAGNVLGSRVSAEWGTRNLFGTGRTLRFKAEYAFDLFAGEDIDFDRIDVTNTFSRYDIVFQQRRVFGTKLRMGINTYLENDATVPDIEVRTLGASVSASRHFARYSDAVVGLSFERVKREGVAITTEDKESNSHILGGSVSRDTRDFILNPRVGEYRVLSSQVAGGFLGGDNDFYTATTTYQRYHGLSRGVVLAWRLRAGYGETYGQSEVVPVENRYFLGGGNSVRGYDESSLGPRETLPDSTERVVGGQFMALANVELRYPIPLLSRWNFSGAVFVDSGNVWEEVADVSGRDFRPLTDEGETTADDYRYGVGLGIRYNTPVGPIRVDYGLALKRDAFTDKNGRFYLSLGQIF